MHPAFQPLTTLRTQTVKVKKVLVSQPKPASDKSPYYDIAEKYGVEIEFRPFIKVEGLSAKEFRQSKIAISDFPFVRGDADLYSGHNEVFLYDRVYSSVFAEIYRLSQT